MPSIQVSSELSSNKYRMKDISQEMFTRTSSKDPMLRSTWKVPVTTYKSTAIRIPNFKQYVGLKTSILANNISTLMTMPYLWDGNEGQDKLLLNLPRKYDIKHDNNALWDLRREQCRFYHDAIDSFLKDIDITWNTIIYWLLAPDSHIRRITEASPEHRHSIITLLDRSAYSVEEFRRGGEKRKPKLFEHTAKWEEFLQQLQEPTAAQLKLSAMACAAILAECEFSAWYMAQSSDIMENYISMKTIAADGVPSFSYSSALCRVCHK
jgi:hypothetical protein